MVNIFKITDILSRNSKASRYRNLVVVKELEVIELKLLSSLGLERFIHKSKIS